MIALRLFSSLQGSIDNKVGIFDLLLFIIFLVRLALNIFFDNALKLLSLDFLFSGLFTES